MSTKNNLKARKLKARLCITACLPVIAITLGMPAKATQQHIEEVTARTHTYQVEVGGTLDEFNTDDYFETYSNHMRLESKFQPNEYLVIENIGDIDVVNPRIVVNGRRNWYSANDILNSVLKADMTDAEKAMAIWTFTSSFETHCHENDCRVGDWDILTNMELSNPVKWANCYYCSGCQFAAAVFVMLCQQAGIPTSNTRTSAMGSAHRVAEVWYDGGWHVYDGDQRTFYIESDNTTLASYDTLHYNPSLCDRTHDGGFASRGMKSRGSSYEKNYPPGIIEIEYIRPYLSTMAMTLRLGEKFVWRWDHIGKWRHGANTRDPLGELEPYQLTNGEMTYEPNLSDSAFPHGTFDSNNIQSVTGDDQLPQLEPVATGVPGYVIYGVDTAYPVVGGRVGGKFFRNSASDQCRIYISVYDANSWIEVWSATSTGELEVEIDIDDDLDPLLTPAIYKYYVKFELQAQTEPNDVFMKNIYIESDVQMSGTALPSLSVGTNNVVYSDESETGAQVRITHGWSESSATVPPLPPAGPVEPGNGGRLFLAPLNKLTWQAATDPDGSIVDYHIQVSPRQDMLHPVSPNFDRIIFSSTPEWNVPNGWLLEDHTYYWRVRAKDDWGAWSDWSQVWSFATTAALDGNRNDDKADFVPFQKALEALDYVRATSIGDSIFSQLEKKYENDEGFSFLKFKLMSAEFLAKQMMSQLKKAADKQMLEVADELINMKKQDDEVEWSHLMALRDVAHAKSFYETFTKLFSKPVKISGLADEEKTFLARYYDLKLKTLTSAVAKAGQNLAIAEPHFRGTHGYVLVLLLLHTQDKNSISFDVLPRWMRQPEQLGVLSDLCLLYFDFPSHAMRLAKESAQIQKKPFSELDFYVSTAKKYGKSHPHIATDCLRKAAYYASKKESDVALQLELIQLWLNSENYAFAADQARKVLETYPNHKQLAKITWLYYYALSKSDNTDEILIYIDKALADKRCEAYKANLMYIKWWAFRRKSDKTARVAVLEYELLKQYGDSAMTAPILLSRAMHLLNLQNYNGAYERLTELVEKFPLTEAAAQAKRVLIKLYPEN